MKKIFGSLAILALLFSAVACNHGTSSIYAEGSLSGKPVYDAGSTEANKWTTSEVTLNLSGAKFTSAITNGSTKLENVSIYGKDGLIGSSFTFTAAESKDAGATSCKFTIAGTDFEEVNYNGPISIVIDNADSYFTFDEGRVQVDSLRISGEMEIKNFASATAAIDSEKKVITITLTGATYTTAATDLTVTVYKGEDDVTGLTFSEVADPAEGKFTIRSSSALEAGTYTIAITNTPLTVVSGYALPTSGMSCSFTIK